LVLAYDLLEDRHTIDVITTKFFLLNFVPRVLWKREDLGNEVVSFCILRDFKMAESFEK